MANTLSKPGTKKETIDGSTERLPFCTSSMRGWRQTQEDSHISQIKLSDHLDTWSMFAVSDGHAGDTISIEVGKRLVGVFLEQPYIQSLTDQNDYDTDLVGKAVTETFITLDKTLDEELEDRKKSANEMGDSHLSNEQVEQIKHDIQDAGCTATVCLITERHFFFINSGDSRQVLVRNEPTWDRSSDYKYTRHPTYQQWIDLESGLQSQIKHAEKRKSDLRSIKTHKLGDEVYNYPEISRDQKRTDELGFWFDYFSTIDHKPDDEEEKSRITGKAQGVVHYGRVDGNLAVSRAFGDFELKRGPYKDGKTLELEPHETKVTVVPKIEVLERDASKDAYLILACDGIYDAIFNDDLVAYITYRMLVGDSLKEIAEGGLEFVLKLGSKDNLSLSIVKLEQAPTVNADMKAKEDSLNKQLLDQIENMFNKPEYDRADQIILPVDKMFRDLYIRDRSQRPENMKNDKDPSYSYFEHILRKNYIFPHGMVMKCDLPQTLMDDEHFGAAMTKSFLIRQYLTDGPDEFRSPKFQEFQAISKKEKAEKKAEKEAANKDKAKKAESPAASDDEA